MTTAAAEKVSVPMSEVRAWAIEKGLPGVNPTGNLSSSIVEAFNKAHRKKQFTRPARAKSTRTGP